MSPTTQGAIVLVVTLLVLLSGAPVAFGLGAVSIVFIVIFQGFDALQVVAETLLRRAATTSRWSRSRCS